MQVGFVMLEAGFARARETVNILAEGIADTFICGILFWAFGFAFMFEPGTPLIGTTGFFLMGKLIEFDRTAVIFKRPSRRETEDYITGRFG